MASIKKRPNGSWRARFRDDAGKEHARHFARRTDAQRWIDEQVTAIVTGQYVNPKAGRMTVRAYAATWQRSQVGRTRTLENVDTALRVHILPRLGDLPLASVTRSDIQGLVKAMETARPPHLKQPPARRQPRLRPVHPPLTRRGQHPVDEQAQHERGLALLTRHGHVDVAVHELPALMLQTRRCDKRLPRHQPAGEPERDRRLALRLPRIPSGLVAAFCQGAPEIL